MDDNIIIKDIYGFYSGEHYKQPYISVASLIETTLKQIPKEHKWDFIRSIGCDTDLTEIITDRLIGVDKGCWVSDDAKQRLRLLEKTYLNDYYAKHNELLKEIELKIKQVETSSSLFYKLYNDYDISEQFKQIIGKRPDLNLNEYTKGYTSECLNKLYQLAEDIKNSIPKITDEEYELISNIENKNSIENKHVKIRIFKVTDNIYLPTKQEKTFALGVGEYIVCIDNNVYIPEWNDISKPYILTDTDINFILTNNTIFDEIL